MGGSGIRIGKLGAFLFGGINIGCMNMVMV